MSDVLWSENGVSTVFDYNHLTDDMHLTTVQDVRPVVEAMNEKRKQDRWKKEVKEDWVHFAKIPAVVEMELLQKGISLYDKNCTKRLIQEIQTNYPYLLAHDGKRLA